VRHRATSSACTGDLGDLPACIQSDEKISNRNGDVLRNRSASRLAVADTHVAYRPADDAREGCDRIVVGNRLRAGDYMGRVVTAVIGERADRDGRNVIDVDKSDATVAR
jgi:hypothetical protein